MKSAVNRTMGSLNRSFQGRDSATLNWSATVFRGLPASRDEMYTRPVSFESFSARRRRMTGVYVSGTHRVTAIQTRPVKAAIRPSIQRQPPA